MSCTNYQYLDMDDELSTMSAFDHETYLSPLTWRYGSDEMRHIWSEAEKRRLLRRVWVALAQAQHEAAHIEVPILLHDVPQDWPAADGDHGLGFEFGLLAQPRAQAAAQDDRSEIRERGHERCPVRRADRPPSW